MNTNKKYFRILLSSAVFFLLFVTLTNPRNIPLYLTLVPFTLLFLIIFSAMRLVLSVFIGDKAASVRLNIFAVMLSVILVNFMLLRSVDQLSIQDAIISTSIALILAVYINKFRLFE